MSVNPPEDKSAVYSALARLVMGALLIGLWSFIVIYIAQHTPKDPENVGNLALLVAGIQSAYAGIGAVHLVNRTKVDWEITAIKALAAGACLGMLGYLVYLGFAQMSVFVADILVALTALNIVNPKNVSDSKSGEAT